jgi:long-subunit acyl-CoA synthetase (AMP-forming)
VTPAEFAADAGVRALIEAHIETVNADLAQVETVKRFSVLPHPFALERGEGACSTPPPHKHFTRLTVSRHHTLTHAQHDTHATHAHVMTRTVTPTMKLKRNVIHSNYAAEIDAIYAQPFTRADA